MRLVDREFWMLVLLAEQKQSIDGEDSSSVKSPSSTSISISVNEENGSHLHIEPSDKVSQLELLDHTRIGKLEIDVYGNQALQKCFVFSYKDSSWEAGLQQLFHLEDSLASEAIRFVERHKGDHSGFVTGYGVGGAYALYVAAATGGMAGVLFDAPGIGKYLHDDQKQQLQVKNYLSSENLFAAIGEHPEEIYFVNPVDTGEDYDSPSEDRPASYAFDSEGNVQVGEQSAAFSFISRMNKLSDVDSELMTEVAYAFAEVAGPRESITDDPAYILLEWLSQVDTGMVGKALRQVEKSFKRRADELYFAWRKEASERYEQAEETDIVEQLNASTEQTMLQLGDLVEHIYDGTEAILSVIVLYYSDQDELIAEVEQGLEDFALRLEQLLNDVSQQMLDYSEQMSSAHVLSFFDLQGEL